MRIRNTGFLVALFAICIDTTTTFAQYTLTTLTTFNGSNGATPSAGLSADAAGNFYGTTQSGGNLALNNGKGDGTVFEVPSNTHVLTTLAAFNSTNGNGPMATVTCDTSGNLYGTTFGGGTNLDGTVFEIAAGTQTITNLANFNGNNGGLPMSAPVLDSTGNLYGTTYGLFYQPGITDPWGNVFEVAHGTHTLSAPVVFNGTNGGEPCSGLISDAAGNLYGAVYGSSGYPNGMVYKLDGVTHAMIVLASFNGSNGANPFSSLITDANGNLFGTTYKGGANGDGTVFEIAAGSGTITPLATFNGTNGSEPMGSLISDDEGNLFGTTYIGGANSDGTVFEVVAGSNTVTTLVAFNGTNGSDPEGGLISDAAGNLYGTTRSGGVNSDGTVFELSSTEVPEPNSVSLLAVAAPRFWSAFDDGARIKQQAISVIVSNNALEIPY